MMLEDNKPPPSSLGTPPDPNRAEGTTPESDLLRDASIDPCRSRLCQGDSSEKTRVIDRVDIRPRDLLRSIGGACLPFPPP